MRYPCPLAQQEGCTASQDIHTRGLSLVISSTHSPRWPKYFHPEVRSFTVQPFLVTNIQLATSSSAVPNVNTHIARTTNTQPASPSGTVGDTAKHDEPWYEKPGILIMSRFLFIILDVETLLPNKKDRNAYISFCQRTNLNNSKSVLSGHPSRKTGCKPTQSQSQLIHGASPSMEYACKPTQNQSQTIHGASPSMAHHTMFFLEQALCVEPGKKFLSKLSQLKDVQSCVSIDEVEFFYHPPGHFCSLYRSPSATSSSARWSFVKTAKALKTTSIYICTTLSSSTKTKKDLSRPYQQAASYKTHRSIHRILGMEWTSCIELPPYLQTASCKTQR